MTRQSTKRQALWLDPGFGASGDMVLGLLTGLGAPVEKVRSELEALDIPGWSLSTETTTRCSLASNRALVTTEEQHHHRTWSSIDAMLAASTMSEPVKAGARATFAKLGQAEAAIHNVTIDEVHFHEVGALDAIIDVVGSWIALDLLDVSEVVCGPVGMGHGTVEAAHGILPIPAPATAALLLGAEVRPVDVADETVTPTGAALLATMADRWGPLPGGMMTALARGAGGRNPDRYPNVLTGILVESDNNPGPVEAASEPVTVLTTNIDDLTPELIAHTVNRCLELGAADAWAAPIVMKKGRPAVELNVMCKPGQADAFLQLLTTETGTLGVRSVTMTKHVMARHVVEVTVRGMPVRMKVGPFGAKPEYEDLVSAGDMLGLPVRQLAIEAAEAHNSSQFSGKTAGGLANDGPTGQTHTP